MINPAGTPAHYLQVGKQLGRKLSNLWSDHPSTDLLIGTVVALIHVWLVYDRKMGNVLHWADHEQRLAVYAAGAGMMSLIAGFAGTAIAQYGSSTGPVVSALRAAHGDAIRRNWLSVTRWLLLGTILCIIAMSIDAEKTPRGSQWLFEAALIMAALKFTRLLFVFGLILFSIDTDVASLRPRKKVGFKFPVGRGD